jgi:hypothetical protein
LILKCGLTNGFAPKVQTKLNTNTSMTRESSLSSESGKASASMVMRYTESSQSILVSLMMRVTSKSTKI